MEKQTHHSSNEAGGPVVENVVVVPQNQGITKDNFLPISILVAGIMISGSVLYSSKPGTALPPSGAPTGGVEAPAANVGDLLKAKERDVVLGDVNAPVTLTIYADFQCPFCARLFTGAETQIREAYVKTGKVKIIYRHLAFLGPESVDAAEASECAKDQGKFWGFHDALYVAEAKDGREHNGNLNRELFSQIAGQIGMNVAQFTSCYDSKKYADYVKQETSDAQAADVSATPNSFINGARIQGAQPYDAFKTAIDKALAQ